MARNCSRAYVLTDSSKLNKAPFGAWAVLPQTFTLITDYTASETDLTPFANDPHIEVIVAPKITRSSAGG